MVWRAYFAKADFSHWGHAHLLFLRMLRSWYKFEDSRSNESKPILSQNAQASDWMKMITIILNFPFINMRKRHICVMLRIQTPMSKMYECEWINLSICGPNPVFSIRIWIGREKSIFWCQSSTSIYSLFRHFSTVSKWHVTSYFWPLNTRNLFFYSKESLIT